MNFIVKKAIKQEMSADQEHRFKRLDEEMKLLYDKIKKLELQQEAHENDPMGHEF